MILCRKWPHGIDPPERLQRAFDVLTGLFDLFGLQTNTVKTVGRSVIFRPSPLVPASDGVTTITQWWMTVSTTKLKIVGYKVLPYVTPWYPLNGILKHPPALASMFSRSQDGSTSLYVLGPTEHGSQGRWVL